jgi:aerobic carbon-monoxide dehydrogenase medium subunit
MKPAAFVYAKARSLDEAIALLREAPGEARLLAGGQSLMPALNMRLDAPKLVIDINGIGLDGIARKNGHVEIGALTRHAAAERSVIVAEMAPLIAKAMPHVGHPAIRNRGTVGGSIANADPAAELPACLLALDGEVEIVGPAGRRAVKAGDFFRGLYETALGDEDVLTTIRVPAASADRRYGFAELCRRRGDYALAGLAASGRVDGQRLQDVRLAFFGVGATPVRAKKAEAALEAGSIDDAVAALDLSPSDDVHASGVYKKHAAGVLLRRVAAELLA